MASQSLYRKWRSQTFGDLVGQEPVIRTLKNALSGGKLFHAYLFTGPRGTGKTSIARLLAKTINCSQTQDGEPCNTCEQCREITIGNSFNVIEIDAASNRGIDSIRELREKVMVPPSTGKYKVYILDEVHMLTVEAFNALLKTLEEPPAHAIFVMATTDVHKLLPTVLSRCQRFDFKRFTTQQIVDRLRYVAQNEGVTLEPGSAELIGRAAAGGMRDALSLLDQAIAYAGATIFLGQVQAMLGVADPRAIQKFIEHIARLDNAAGLHLIHELAEAGADLRQLNTQVAEYFRAMMLARAGAAITEILDLTGDEIQEITEVAALFRLEELTSCARVFAQNELIQKNQGTPQLGLELAFLSCVGIHRQAQSGQVPAASVAVPSPPPASRPSPPASSPPVSVKPAVVVPPAPVISTPVPSVVEATASPDLPEWDDMPSRDDEEERLAVPVQPVAMQTPPAPAPTEPVVVVEESQEAEQAGGSVLTLEEVREKWELVKRRVKSKKDGAKIAAFLNGFALSSVDSQGPVPVVVIQANMEFHYKSLQNAVHHGAIEWALKIELHQECTLRLLPPGKGGNVPLPPPPPNGGEPALNNLAGTMPRQSAHRERIAPPSPVRPPQSAAPPQAQVAVQPAKEQASPLARNAAVRENSNEPGTSTPPATGETRLEMVTRKVKDNLVVQEAVRLFKADIKNIQLK